MRNGYVVFVGNMKKMYCKLHSTMTSFEENSDGTFSQWRFDVYTLRIQMSKHFEIWPSKSWRVHFSLEYYIHTNTHDCVLLPFCFVYRYNNWGFAFVCNFIIQSSIEVLNFLIVSRLDPETSRSFVKAVLTLPNLKTLMLDGIGNLDESCFTTFNSYFSKCQVRLPSSKLTFIHHCFVLVVFENITNGSFVTEYTCLTFYVSLGISPYLISREIVFLKDYNKAKLFS